MGHAWGTHSWPANALRHSFATYHLGQCGNPGTTAFQMGHTNPAMVQRAHAVPAPELADRVEDEGGERYRSIVAHRASQSKFLKGWLNRNRALERWWMELTS